MYRLDVRINNNEPDHTSFATSSSSNEMTTWHNLLGHIAIPRRKQLFPDIPNTPITHCEPCLMGEST
jgi:hypothetical protein